MPNFTDEFNQRIYAILDHEDLLDESELTLLTFNKSTLDSTDLQPIEQRLGISPSLRSKFDI
jgi:hypothetical protein